MSRHPSDSGPADRDDLPRLRDAGSDDEQSLLRAAPVPEIDDRQRKAILRLLEERLSPPAQRRRLHRLLLAMASTLLAGSALAYGVTRLHRPPPPVAAPPPESSTRRPPPTPPARLARTPTASAAATDEAAAPSGPPAAASSSARAEAPSSVGPPPRAPLGGRALGGAHPTGVGSRSAVAPRELAARSPPPTSPFGGPALREPGDMFVVPAPVEDGPGVPVAAPRLVITGPGPDELAVVLAGERVVGQARSGRVDLEVTSAQITGTVGHRQVSLWLYGREAEGNVGGQPVRFQLSPTPGGHALRATRVGRGPLFARDTLIETTPEGLVWPPGCTTPLAATAPGVYEGACPPRGSTRVSIPAAWQRLAELPRLVLLALFLSDRPRP